MAKAFRGLVSAVALVVLTISALVVVPPSVAAASRVWTSDADFTSTGAGGSTPIFISTEVVGTGAPAKVELVKNTIDWKNNNPSGPTPGGLEGPSAAFESDGNKTVLFGGYNGGFPNPYSDKTWEFDYVANTWTEITSSPKPPARQSAGASYDPVQKVVVLFGGFNDTDFLTDTWEYDVTTNTWTQIFPPSSPPPMVDNPLTYHASAGLHLFIGQSLVSGNMETWAYNAGTDTWANRNPSGMPSARSGFALAYHAARDRTVLFGGAFFMTLYDQTFEYTYSSNSWTQVGVTGPSARAGHSMTYRPTSNSVLLFGGLTGSGASQETWRYTTTPAWESVSTTTRPPARRYAAFAYDTPNDAAVLYGGLDAGGSRLADTWTLGAAYAAAGKYTSAVFDSGAGNVDWQFLWWNKTSQPANTFLRFQLAASNSVTGPFSFVGPGGSPSAYYTTAGTAIWSGHDNQRYLKFLGDFGSTDTQATPSMEDVTIVYNVPPSPPYIVSTDPVNIEFNVPLGKWINVTFSEPMNTATVTWTVVAINPAGGFVPPLTASWSGGDTVLTLSHTVPWRENTVYRATITAGKDLDGFDLVANPVDPNVVNPWIFVTEKQNPYITKTTPPSGYGFTPPGYILTRPIYVDFNEGMNTSSVVWTVNTVPSGGFVPTFTATWANQDRNLTLSHAAPFTQCTEYRVQINGTDKVNLPLIPGAVPNPWSFISECINPYLVATVPTNLQSDVPLNQAIIVDFSEPMNTGSVTWTLIRGPAVTFSPTWTNGNRRLTLSHTQNFPGCAVYEIRINGNDVDGNPLIAGPPSAAPNPWTFVTLCDNPYIVMTVPADGATNVSQTQEILIAFSEQMNEATVTWTINPQPIEINNFWDASVLLHVQYLFLNQCTRYTFTVTGGRNQAGFNLVPGPAPNPFSFDTICTAPYLTATDPADGATLVPVDKTVIADFSEPMDTGNTIWLVDTVPSGGFVPTFTPSWSNGDTRLTLTHTAPFSDCTVYQFFIDGLDKQGESMLTGPNTPGVPNPWTFTTRCAGFYLTRTDPANGQQNVPQTANVVVEFSQPVNTGTFTLTTSPPITFNAPVWTNGNTVATVSHATPFTECVTYTATVTALNLTGQPLNNGIPGAAPNPWTFKVTCIPPQILTTNPVDGAVGVPVAAPIVVTFSEAMNPSSVTWTIVPNIALTPTWSGGNTVLTLSHTAPFLANTLYTIQVRGNDVDGNALVAGPVPNPWSFTTATGLSAPRALQVIRSAPNDILLTWLPVTGASSYVVYSSINRFNAWPWPQLAEVAATSYFATNHLSDGSPHYYIVRAKDATGTLSANSTMGAKVPLSFAFNNGRSNVYWMSLPYRSMYKKASDISNELTSTRIDVIGKWNPATQSTILWYFFRGAWRGIDFTLNPGDGFYIGVRSSFSWVINGTDGAVPRTFTLYPPPNANINWISLPSTSTYQRASDLVLDIEGSLGPTANTRIIEVARWDPLTQSLQVFRWTPTGWSGTDFTMGLGEGVYLKVVSTFTWTPRLLTPEVP